jgi:hypothetical protein
LAKIFRQNHLSQFANILVLVFGRTDCQAGNGKFCCYPVVQV